MDSRAYIPGTGSAWSNLSDYAVNANCWKAGPTYYRAIKVSDHTDPKDPATNPDYWEEQDPLFTKIQFNIGHNVNMTLTMPAITVATVVTLYGSADGTNYAPLWLDNAAAECKYTADGSARSWNISGLGVTWFKIGISVAEAADSVIQISAKY